MAWSEDGLRMLGEKRRVRLKSRLAIDNLIMHEVSPEEKTKITILVHRQLLSSPSRSTSQQGTLIAPSGKVVETTRAFDCRVNLQALQSHRGDEGGHQPGLRTFLADK